MPVYSMTGYASASGPAAADEQPADDAGLPSRPRVTRRIAFGQRPFSRLGVAPAGRPARPGAGVARAGRRGLQARQDRTAPGHASAMPTRPGRRPTPEQLEPPDPRSKASCGLAAQARRRCRCTRRCSGAAAARRPSASTRPRSKRRADALAGLREAREREGARLVAVLLRARGAPARAGRAGRAAGARGGAAPAGALSRALERSAARRRRSPERDAPRRCRSAR